MRLKQKLATLFTTLSLFACVTVGAVLPVLADSFYDATGDWTKVGGDTVSMTATQDGAVHLSEAVTGSWAAEAYTSVTYNYGVIIDNGIDLYVNVLSGKTHIALANNGWYYNMQGSSGNASTAADIMINNKVTPVSVEDIIHDLTIIKVI